MRRVLADLRYAARSLARTPLFTLGVVATLALGIGVNAAMFGVVDALFLRPPAGVRDAGGVTRISVRRIDPTFGTRISRVTNYPVFTDLREAALFDRIAAVTTRDVSLGRGAEARQVHVAYVSHDYFPLLGVIAQRGRLFGPADDTPGAERVVVLTDAFWRSHFAADSGVVGRSFLLGSGMVTVVGVAPRGFTGIDLEPVDAFVAISAAARDVVGDGALTSRTWWWMTMIARLPAGQPRAGVAARATAVYRRGMVEASPEDSTAQVLLGPIQAARGPEPSDDARVAAWIGLVAVVVLLIACANVANLLLARAMARRRELAVRVGLGAGRAGLVRLLLGESLVLATAGGAAAIVLAAWTGAAARGFLVPSLPAAASFVDLRVLAFTAVAVLITMLIVGLVPALQATRPGLVESLKSGGIGATARGGRTRIALLVTQVALTLVLLVGAGLFVRSLQHVQHIDLGFDADRVLEASVNMDAAGLAVPDANATYLRILDRVRQLPGVADAAGTMSPWGWGWAVTIRAQGVDSLPRLATGGPYVNAVTPTYFATLGTRVLEGRVFDAGDGPSGARVAVVNATFAHRVWPRADAIGRCLYIGSDTARVCTRVVGVVGDAKQDRVTEGETMLYYVPFAQAEAVGAARINALVVRARGRPDDVAGAVRREVQAAGDLPFANVETLADRIAPDFRSWQLGAAAFTAFGALALLIAAMGMFAVISYGVSQRTHEIGVRMALGAEAALVARMVLGQGLRTTALGVVVGGAGAWALGRGLRALLYEVAPADPLVFATVVALLIAVAALAAWLPARRAAAVDPLVALRYE